MKYELGQVIAQRSLKAVDKDHGEMKIKVFLGSPCSIPESSDVYAPYQIEYCSRVRLYYAIGIDGFQALYLAMKMIVVEIEAIERKYNIKVNGDKDYKDSFGNLGF